jgi:hypothetical protein
MDDLVPHAAHLNQRKFRVICGEVGIHLLNIICSLTDNLDIAYNRILNLLSLFKCSLVFQGLKVVGRPLYGLRDVL